MMDANPMPEAIPGESVACLERPGGNVANVAKRARWRKVFLNALRKDGNITRAAGMAGITARQAYRVRKSSERFAKAWDDAIEESDRRTADEFQRRFRHHAKHGYKKPVYQGGRLVGFERKHYPQLLLRGLEAEMREKYAPRNTSQGQAVNVVVNVQNQQRALADPSVADLVCRLDALMTAPRALEAPGSDPEPGTADLPA